MGFLGFGRKSGTHLVVVSVEGPGRLRINGNIARSQRTKQNAAEHAQTVCWIEFMPDGARGDQGTGPASSRLGPGEVDRLLRDLPQTAACRAVRENLEAGKERASHWLPWGKPGGARGSVGEQGRA